MNEEQGLRVLADLGNYELLGDFSTGLEVRCFKHGPSAGSFITVVPGRCKWYYLMLRNDLKAVKGVRMEVTDVGQHGPSFWVTDGTVWRPESSILLSRSNGRVAAPIATLTGVTTGTFGGILATLPPGLITTPNLRIRTLVNLKRTTAVATANYQIVAGLITLGIYPTTATANLEYRIELDVMTTTGDALVTGVTPPGGTSSTGAGFGDKTINATSAIPFTIQLGAANIADSFSLLSYDITLS